MRVLEPMVIYVNLFFKDSLMLFPVVGSMDYYITFHFLFSCKTISIFDVWGVSKRRSCGKGAFKFPKWTSKNIRPRNFIFSTQLARPWTLSPIRKLLSQFIKSNPRTSLKRRHSNFSGPELIYDGQRYISKQINFHLTKVSN